MMDVSGLLGGWGAFAFTVTTERLHIVHLVIGLVMLS